MRWVSFSNRRHAKTPFHRIAWRASARPIAPGNVESAAVQDPRPLRRAMRRGARPNESANATTSHPEFFDKRRLQNSGWRCEKRSQQAIRGTRREQWLQTEQTRKPSVRRKSRKFPAIWPYGEYQLQSAAHRWHTGRLARESNRADDVFSSRWNLAVGRHVESAEYFNPQRSLSAFPRGESLPGLAMPLCSQNFRPGFPGAEFEL